MYLQISLLLKATGLVRYMIYEFIDVTDVQKDKTITPKNQMTFRHHNKVQL